MEGSIKTNPIICDPIYSKIDYILIWFKLNKSSGNFGKGDECQT